MDIKITRNGKIFYEVDNTLAAILIEALPGSFERVVPRPAPTPAAFEVRWGVNPNPYSGFYQVDFRQGDRKEVFWGPPSLLVGYYQKMGIVVPQTIAEQYTALWKPRENDHPSWWAEYEQIQQRKK